MPIVDILRKNAALYGNDDALVELNYDAQESKSWSELELVESAHHFGARRVMTWKEFDDASNRFANHLLSIGIKKDDKVAILLMNCLEWLPAYFGILKTGAWAVPLNYRIPAEEIRYSLEKSEASVLLFGEDTLDRVESIRENLTGIREFLYTGEHMPAFAKDYGETIAAMPTDDPMIPLTDETCSCAFPRCITRARKCTGSAAFSSAARQYCCARPRRSGFCAPQAKRNARSYG